MLEGLRPRAGAGSDGTEGQPLGGCGGGALGGAGQPVTDKEASGKSGPQETTTKSPSLNLGLVGVQPQLYTTAEWMAKEEPPGEVEN